MKNGILVIDKQPGMTSFGVIARLRSLTGVRKIGHGGTLDPMATGVLPVFFGAATKAQDLCCDKRKRYTATALLGTSSDTADITGNILERQIVNCTKQQLLLAIAGFVGKSSQLPPMYSAIKVDGRRLYTLARKGDEIERKPRDIEVYSINTLVIDLEENTMTLDILCSSGTYIRTLCEDIAKGAGTIACLSALRRTASGCFSIEEALTLDQVEQSITEGRLEQQIIPVSRLFSDLPEVVLDENLARLFTGGTPFEEQRIDTVPQAGERASVWHSGQLLGLGCIENGYFKKIFHYPAENA